MRSSTPAPPVVSTAVGRMRGTWLQDSAVFRGIPYAEAPVGPLRFSAPVARTPWEGTLDVTSFGATPLRGDGGITLIPEHAVAGDDTLSVNIWTPSPGPEAALPVVVWIHGGGFVSGSPASPWYDGRAFARDGIVLVTISYRLGFQGFGWIEDAVPNRGVLDWICALKWVNQHIAAFGGDPSKVTIAGQSAGGGAVLTLLGAPAAAGLFRAGYAMSAAVADPSVEAAKQRSQHLAKLAGVPATAAGFESVSESRILELQPRITKPAAPHLLRDVHELLRDGLMLGPIADGRVVAELPAAGVASGASARVPLVIGSTEGELDGLFKPERLLDHLPRKAMLRTLGATPEEATRWLSSRPAHEADGSMELLGRYATDAVFHSWIPRVAAARAAANAGPTWSYRFRWHGDSPPHAGHCIDVPFLFDRLDAQGVEAVAGQHPPQSLADEVHGAMVNFARDLNPGWPADVAGLGPNRIFDSPAVSLADAYGSARALTQPLAP